MSPVINKRAAFSPCRTFRYSLWHQWGDDSLGYAMFIGLNPSTADETLDDPTVRRCINFARDWGYGALCMTNLFAFRSTDPSVMKAHPDAYSGPKTPPNPAQRSQSFRFKQANDSAPNLTSKSA